MKKGFTLVELLIVIAIIGILAGAILVNTLGASRRANDSKAFSIMQSLSRAISSCVIGGGTIAIPVSNGTGGGGQICNTSSEIFPDLTSTGYQYESTSWAQSTPNNAISIHSLGSYSKIIVCGAGLNADAWYAGFHSGVSFNFIGTNACVKVGF